MRNGAEGDPSIDRDGEARSDAGAPAPRLEILLLRRARSAGFVPGAWVFPGGRVDSDDARPELVERLDGLDPDRAARRLDVAPDADPPAIAYWIAALREAFEETGILMGRDSGGRPPPSAASDPAMRAARDRLLEDENIFASILDDLDLRLDASAVAYIAHWITPEPEPRRYDTRFFAAAVGSEQAAVDLHPAEASDALWLTPHDALERHGRGELPMIFPTLRTLHDLRPFSSPAEVLGHFRDRPIPTFRPRLVRTATGLAIELPDPNEDRA